MGTDAPTQKLKTTRKRRKRRPTEEIIDRQQEVADRLFTVGLIRQEVPVREAMWRAEW